MTVAETRKRNHFITSNMEAKIKRNEIVGNQNIDSNRDMLIQDYQQLHSKIPKMVKKDAVTEFRQKEIAAKKRDQDSEGMQGIFAINHRGTQQQQQEQFKEEDLEQQSSENSSNGADDQFDRNLRDIEIELKQ